MSVIESQPTAPNPKRRWFHYSLRTMLLLMTVFAVWPGWYMYQRQREERAAAKIRSLGGEVALSYGSVFEALGVANPSFVSLSGKGITDEDLRAVEQLSGLKWLGLSHNQITDDGLAHLENLTKLQDLDLKCNPAITDAGLVHLEGLSNLRLVVLYGTQVTPDGASRLKRALPNVKVGLGAGRPSATPAAANTQQPQGSAAPNQPSC